jgi:Domain of unknown function (DUF4439)
VTELGALQAALAAEQATIYGYGVIGAIVRGSDRDVASAALLSHERIRDQLMAMIAALGATPVTARPAYQLPFVGHDATSARALAAQLEEGVCGAAWDVVAAAAAASAVRVAAIGWLATAAQRAQHWGTTQALPGQPA